MAEAGAAPEGAQTLETLRAEIDRLDLELLERLNARARAAEAVAEVKRRQAPSDGSAPPQFFRPEREAAVLARLREANAGPLPDDMVVGLSGK